MNITKPVKIPKHVGILLNGTREWALERNLSLIDGYAESYAIMKMAPLWFFESGVKIVTMYVFGEEIWNSDREEVNKLMKLTRHALDIGIDKFNKDNYRVVFSGRIDELPGDLSELCCDIEAETKNNTGGTLNICLNYNGKTEILDSIRKMFKNNITFEQIHEGMMGKNLYHSEFGDFDLVVQTGNRRNLSGFNLWQLNGGEIIFLKKYWPDFEKQDVGLVIEKFNRIKNDYQQ